METLEQIDARIARIMSKADAFRFLDWLEYWADRRLELGFDGYFGYMETVQLPPPPDNPEIMGRKMGWIK